MTADIYLHIRATDRNDRAEIFSQIRDYGINGEVHEDQSFDFMPLTDGDREEVEEILDDLDVRFKLIRRMP